MIKIQNISLYQGSQLLIDHGDAFIQTQQKVGIVGNNGSGKTSLLHALLGHLELHGGEINLPNNLSIAHIEQNIPSMVETAIYYVMRAKPDCHDIYTRLQSAELNSDMEQVAFLHAELTEMNGYAFKAQAEKTLTGLGFTQLQLTQSIASFSGGWRMRLHLAKCLLVQTDLLLLDEPTNHLDLNGILWLQNWLQQYPGTLLLISHDRDFLDNTVTHILHLHQHKLQLYTGNYTSFVDQRAQALMLQAAQYKKQQLQIKHMQSYVNRFRYKASKAKQAQSRLKAIERLEKVAPLLAEFDLNFDFEQPDTLSNPLINLHHLSAGYEGKVLLSNINLSIENQSRIGILGANGAGKSTLLKTLLGELVPLHGELIRNNKLKIGYFSQHHVESFDPQHSPLNVMQLLAPRMNESQLRSYLGVFGFSGDKALLNTHKLSGGEKARLALATIIWQRPHILLFDEPTNHLDLNMREALNLALQNYNGAIVLITHDRFLLRSVAEELWLINQGSVKIFTGDLDDYAELLLQSNLGVTSKIIKKQNAPSAETQRQLLELEKQINKFTRELEKLDSELIQLSQTSEIDHKRLAQLDAAKQKISRQMQECEEKWYALQEAAL